MPSIRTKLLRLAGETHIGHRVLPTNWGRFSLTFWLADHASDFWLMKISNSQINKFALAFWLVERWERKNYFSIEVLKWNFHIFFRTLAMEVCSLPDNVIRIESKIIFFNNLVDSGGPIQITLAENRCIRHIIGVTSFGAYCGGANVPAFYTRVSSYLDWIEAKVWNWWWWIDMKSF